MNFFIVTFRLVSKKEKAKMKPSGKQNLDAPDREEPGSVRNTGKLSGNLSEAASIKAISPLDVEKTPASSLRVEGTSSEADISAKGNLHDSDYLT
ncbi:unnamed protein product [Angiostrongylus costaricensis]|uniref:Ovule protein n=1 Tax=Angiostrongylus costaricensis TaxID=334426 RepID=A0A0R3PPT9_ANGCS|nr:unnamed protein product [Angiostrongylus costaricensis]